MNKLANIYRLGVKELRGLAHDRILSIFIIWAFSVGIYTAATAASRELHNAPIAVVDEDNSALSSRIINAFYGPYFNTPQLIGLNDIDPSMDEGTYTFVLDIPPNFSRDVQAGKNPDIQVNIDATRMTQAFIGATYIRNIIVRELAEFTRDSSKGFELPISLNTYVKFNPNLTGSWYGAVMELINNVTLLSIILTGAALVREREHGTIEHLLVMPIGAAEVMLAKVWSMGLVVLIAAGLSIYIVIKGALAVPIIGSVPLFMIGALLHLFATTSIGIFLGTIARNMPQLGILMILVILPLQMLSGAITPRESMPDIVQNIMLIAPTTHFVNLSQAILYRGASLDVVWPQFVAIIGIGAVFFMLALSLFRRSLAASQ
jgi:ABC-2 type transport system permease protein